MSGDINFSGLYYPNEFSRIIMDGLDEIIGKSGVVEVISKANLTNTVDQNFSSDLRNGLDFAEISNLQLALESIYGVRGSRSLAIRLGRKFYETVNPRFEILTNVGDRQNPNSSKSEKINIELRKIAEFFNQMSDQITTIHENKDSFCYTVHRCPICWGRSGETQPVCNITAGMLQEGIKNIISGMELRVEEHQCMAMGDDVCEFLIEKQFLE